MDKKYEALFTPWKIGNVEIKNRIVLAPMGGTCIFGWTEPNHFDKEAAKLLNSVRKRNYPAGNLSQYLYQPEGTVQLTEQELLDEWGREFLSESRRRTDLIRFDKFCTGKWWDKQPDADKHTEIFPLHRDILNANPNLNQNEGYPRPE